MPIQADDVALRQRHVERLVSLAVVDGLQGDQVGAKLAHLALLLPDRQSEFAGGFVGVGHHHKAAVAPPVLVPALLPQIDRPGDRGILAAGNDVQVAIRDLACGGLASPALPP